MTVGPLRLLIAVACFALSFVALRIAIRRLFVALATWLLGGALFMTGLLFLAAAGWRLIRAALARRRPRPAA